MSKAVIETDDWKLGCYLEWRQKNHAEECPTCHGRKEIGGGFKDMDGPRPCPECFGAGFLSRPPKGPAPEIPPALREHLRRAWWDFLHEPDPEASPTQPPEQPPTTEGEMT